MGPVLDGAGDTVMKTAQLSWLHSPGRREEDHFQRVTAQRGQGWEGGGEQVNESPGKAPDSPWEVRRASWRRR